MKWTLRPKIPTLSRRQVVHYVTFHNRSSLYRCTFPVALHDWQRIKHTAIDQLFECFRIGNLYLFGKYCFISLHLSCWAEFPRLWLKIFNIWERKNVGFYLFKWRWIFSMVLFKKGCFNIPLPYPCTLSAPLPLPFFHLTSYLIYWLIFQFSSLARILYLR